jgi:hydrogenase maturation protease
MEDPRHDILVLGIGNLLWADEGFGVRCVEALAAEYEFPDSVRLMDGGTQGLYLLPYVEAARRLIVFDAVDYGLAPGTLKLVENEEVPMFLGAKKMSLHQTGFQEVLACAALHERLPREMLLIGVQPVELEDYGGSLRPEVKARIPVALSLALERLGRWGVTPRPAEVGQRLNAAGLEMGAYEGGRPSEREACRIGDARFLYGLGE